MRKLIASALLCLGLSYPASADLTLTGVDTYSSKSTICTSPICLVQNAATSSGSGGSVTTQAATLTGTTAGHLIVVGVGACNNNSCTGGTARTFTSVTSSNSGSGETCSQASGAQFSSTLTELDIWYCKNIVGGTDTITATISGGATGFFWSVNLSEWSGASTTVPLDTVTPNETTCSGSSPCSTPTAASTSTANEIVYSLAYIFGVTANPGQTAINSSTDEYQKAPTTGTYTNTFTWAGSSTGGAQAIAAFKH